MKKLIIVFSLIAGSVVGQHDFTPSRVEEDKALSKYVFDYINTYRDSINQKPYIWSEAWYDKSKEWCDYLSVNDEWRHSDGDPCMGFFELIVAVTLIDEENDNYKFIADSALRQWLSSNTHKGLIRAPRGEFVNDIGTVWYGTKYRDAMLVKYGAISANVLYIDNWKQIKIVFQLAICE